MTLMIACCSPAESFLEETLSTLNYATRARNIQNRPMIQMDPKEQLIFNLRQEAKLLRLENEFLRQQIAHNGGVVRFKDFVVVVAMVLGQACSDTCCVALLLVCCCVGLPCECTTMNHCCVAVDHVVAGDCIVYVDYCIERGSSCDRGLSCNCGRLYCIRGLLY
jgi:hypothetical protein